MKQLLLSVFTVLFLSVGTAWANTDDNADAAYKRGDYTKAVKLYRLSAAQGNAYAQFNLGYMYHSGQGVKQDYAEAMKWYRLAAVQGDAKAQFQLGEMYRDGEYYAEAVKWYRLSAVQGNKYAQASLGYMYEKGGRGVAQDYAEAVKLYRLAAAQGDAHAQFQLGEMYSDGKGVTRDYVRAHMWFNLSDASGIKDAVKFGDLLATYKMTSQQIAQAQKMARDCQQKNFKGCD